MKDHDVHSSVAPPQKQATCRGIAGTLIVIALVWLLLPGGSTIYRGSEPVQGEQVFTVFHQSQLGLGSASWATLSREGVGEYGAIEWQPWQLAFHPQPMTALPLVMLLLGLLWRLPFVAVRIDPLLLSAASSARRGATELGQASGYGFAAAVIIVILAAWALPAEHITTLERADAEELKMRLSAQLADSDVRHDLRLDRSEEGVPRLHIVVYRRGMLDIGSFDPLLAATELERRDLSMFAHRASTAALWLGALGGLAMALALLLGQARVAGRASGLDRKQEAASG